MRRFLFWVVLPGMLSAPSGCASSASEGNVSCDGVTACSAVGIERCNASLSAIEQCQANADNCLVWNVLEACGQGATCTAGTGQPACIAGCVDQCAVEGGTQCSADAVQSCTIGANGCLSWLETEACTGASEYCDDSGPSAVCTTCTDLCPTAGDTQCSAEVIESCAADANGCLDWLAGTDCSALDPAQICDDSAEPAECVAACSDGCVAADTRCAGSAVETCAVGSSGCLQWVPGTDCATLDPVNDCVDNGNVAACVVHQGDGTCADPLVMTGLAFTLAGNDFTADFANNLDLIDASCTDNNTGTPDAVVAVDLYAHETLLVRELGGLNAVLALQETCGSTEACVVSEDFEETTGYRYTASVDGRVYVLVEAYYADPALADYDIRLNIAPPEDCDNLVDDDVDGSTDCDDSDCFGQVGCTVELNCGDGADNDSDGFADCDDSDCTASPACVPYQGVYEIFQISPDVFDLEGMSLTFTPDGSPMGFSWVSADGSGGYPVVPGSGTPSTTLFLSDDTFTPYTLSGMGMGSFSFYGAAYTSLYVGSNGYVTFGTGSGTVVDTVAELFARPTIALLGEDLNPGASGASVIVDEFGSAVAITFDAVPFYGESSTNDLQLILSDDGRIAFHYVAVPASGIDTGDGIVVGVSSGVGILPYPAESDLFVPPSEIPRINEIRYDQDGTDIGEFVELTGPPGLDLTGFSLVHINGTNGATTWAADLTGRSIPVDGFWVVGSTNVPERDAAWADFGVADTNALQNSEEALVLAWHWGAGDQVIYDAVAWLGVASLPAWAYEATPTAGIEIASWNNSIGRYPDRSDTNDNSVDLVQSWWPTPGAPNTPAQPGSTYNRATYSSQGEQAAPRVPLAIPDNDATGINVTLDGEAFLGASIADIQVGVRIAHSWCGDLRVTLTSPTGTTVVLHNRTGGSADNIETVYDLYTVPAESLDAFNDQNPVGVTWTLHIDDNSAIATGSLLEWVLWVDSV
jgi:subtilisin-like proprotein convertase family protein